MEDSAVNEQRVVIDEYDRLVGALDGLPDVLKSRPTTIDTVTPIVGAEKSFIITTIRQADAGCTVLVKYIDAEGGRRFVLPPKVVEAIIRQRDALNEQHRRRVARAAAQERKARGEKPGFQLSLAERKARKAAKKVEVT